MITIKDAEDAPQSDGERVSNARIFPRQSERTTDADTSHSRSEEDHTVNVPCIKDTYESNLNNLLRDHVEIFRKKLSAGPPTKLPPFKIELTPDAKPVEFR